MQVLKQPEHGRALANKKQKNVPSLRQTVIDSEQLQEFCEWQ